MKAGARLKTKIGLLRKSAYRQHDGKEINLIGFVKTYNEGYNGNLERCLKHLSQFCDGLVVCDDSSRDNTLDVARKYTRNIIVMPDDFRSELQHKQKLLEQALYLKPDWIVWLDPDEVFDRDGELWAIRALCAYGEEQGIDAFSFLYHNLWKSKTKYRVDERWLTNWQPKLWRNTGELSFEIMDGLHHRQYPLGLDKIRRTDVKIIHYGFSTDALVKRKYETYKALGQSGHLLERVRNDSDIKFKEINIDWVPLSTLKVVVVCLIYKSVGYLNFVYNSFKKHAAGADFLFVANDATEEVVDYLTARGIPHLIHTSHDRDEYYLNRVYRAWNYGGFNAQGDIIVFVNSDMAFSDGWLQNLLKSIRRDRIVTARLVESGKLRSGKYGISRNFGRTYKEFDEEEFKAYAEKIKSDKLKRDGLFMPCAIYRDAFIKSGGYPIGNRTERDGQTTSGDKIFFYERLRKVGIKHHYTAFDSIVYHIQEGEMDETLPSTQIQAV